MKKAYIHLQVEEELKKQLENEAKEKHLSLNAYIRILLYERGK